MKIKLYHDQRRKHQDAADSWSIYCPYPKKYRAATGIKGVLLGCKPTEDGIVRCCWMEDEIGKNIYLGKRIDVASTPKAFQAIFKHIAKVFNKACKEDTKEAWQAFTNV